MPQVDKDFLAANLQDKTAYLSSVDPDFKKAPPHEQLAYIQHVSQQMQPAGQSQVEKTAPPPNYGFTAGNLLHGLGEGVKSTIGGIYSLGKDVVNNPNWVTGPDSTYEKFVGAPGEAEAHKASDLWNKGGVSNRVQAAGHELAGAVPFVGPWAAHLGEKAGTGDVGGATAEAAGAVGTGYALPRIRGAARDLVYQDMPPSGRGPQLTPFAKQGARVAGGAAGIGLAPKIPYEAAVGGALVGPEILKKVVGTPEAGSVKNPGPYSKIKERVPASVMKEEQAPATSTPVPPTASTPRARMGPPLRPNVFASPEEAQIYDNHMSRLGAEAKDAGMYSAARGKVGRVPDYQERTGAAMSPFGGGSPPPSELSPPSTIRPYAPDPGTRSPDFDLHQQATERAVSEMKSGSLPEGMTTSGRAQQILDELKKAK